MNIETAKKEHIDEIFTLENTCFSCPRSIKALEEEIESPMSVFLAATQNGAVMGYGGMHLICGEGYIDNIAIFAHYRRQGVARGLINKLKEHVTEFLSLEVRESNTAAIALYTKLGFKFEGKRKGFYTNPVEDGLIYTWHKREVVN